MTLDLATTAIPADSRTPGRRQRREERQRLLRQDRRSAQIAGLLHIRTVAADARLLVDAGWVQNSWFRYRDTLGQQRIVTAQNLHQLGGHPVTGACLVGGIVQAGGGLGAVSSQPVQRALDLTWHTLFARGDDPVRWCPAPSIRAVHVRDLTRWNDHPGRTVDDVSTLLRDVELAASTEMQRVHG